MGTVVSKGDVMRWWRHSPGRRVVLAGGAVALFGVLGAWWALARAFDVQGVGPAGLQSDYVQVETTGKAAVEATPDPNGAR